MGAWAPTAASPTTTTKFTNSRTAARRVALGQRNDRRSNGKQNPRRLPAGDSLIRQIAIRRSGIEVAMDAEAELPVVDIRGRCRIADDDVTRQHVVRHVGAVQLGVQ